MNEHDQLLERVAQELERRRWGKYRGIVEDNEDPQKQGRLKLRVPSVYGPQITDWAVACLPFGGAPDHGLFLLPEKQDRVWVEFEEGDIDRPMWSGYVWPDEAEAPPIGRRTLVTPKGHRLELVDVDDEEAILITHCGEAKIEIDPKGTLRLQDRSGGHVVLDADGEELVLGDKHGNTISMGSAGVVIEDVNGNKIELSSNGVTITADAVDIA